MSSPKRFAAYRVTYSDVPEVPVGMVLTDKGWSLRGHWTTFNSDTEGFASFGGPRIARLCGTCRVEFGRVTPFGHDGECRRETPHLRPDEADQ